uniref:SFRICE001900.2 n=1 Tax=Spodoptera frugiperda TaxID=7108 RepID=A0A2H1WDA0_SPOFR
MSPILYKLAASPPACAVRMVAHIIGLKLDYKEPDITKMEHKSPDYLKLNPLGTIPVLVDDDFILADSHAIMIYLLSKYGGEHSERLYPSDVRTRAIVNQVMFFDTGILFVRIKVVALPTIMEGMKAPTQKHLNDLEEAYGMVEAYASKYKYIAADHLTIADLSLAMTMGAAQVIHKLDHKKFPNTYNWLSLVEKEPYFIQIGLPGIAKFNTAMQYYTARNNQ